MKTLSTIGSWPVLACAITALAVGSVTVAALSSDKTGSSTVVAVPSRISFGRIAVGTVITRTVLLAATRR